MHDIKEIRRDPDLFYREVGRRGYNVPIDELLELDNRKRELTNTFDQLRQRRNSVSKQIGQARKNDQDTDDLQIEMRRLGDELKQGEKDKKDISENIRQILLDIPNIPAEMTPDGLTEKDNVIIREWGPVQEYEFDPLDHLAIAERLNILDFMRGGKVTGSGFPVWVGDGALMERALLNFMLDLQTHEHGYTEMMTPFLANRHSMIGTGQIPHLEDDMYYCDRDDLFLIPTSEVTLINLHRDEILLEEQLPIKYAAYSPCFRREAGSWGHHTRGFLRTHQFNKVEMVRIEQPEHSYKVLEELLRHAEEVLRRLELRYRVVKLCAGELSFQAAACYDIEVWAPAEGGRWLEVSSCSNCEAFQAKRAGIRFRPKKGNKVQYVHTLNGSGLATSRLMVALLESWQTAEGSIAVPPVLRSYMGGKSVITSSGGSF